MSINSASRIISLTLTGGYKPNVNDFVIGRALGVTNPSQSGSYVIDVTTKNTL